MSASMKLIAAAAMVVAAVGFYMLATFDRVAGNNDTAAAPAAAVANPTLVIAVNGAAQGAIEIELLSNLAPNHVARIVELAKAGKYDGVVFHRVIDGFMAQTGDVKFGLRDSENLRSAGQGGSDLPNLTAEFSDEKFVTGTVGMARSNSPDSANSQFFIMFGPAPFLDGQYTVVGKVIAGQDVVNAIKRGNEAANGTVQDPDYMEKVSIK